MSLACELCFVITNCELWLVNNRNFWIWLWICDLRLHLWLALIADLRLVNCVSWLQIVNCDLRIATSEFDYEFVICEFICDLLWLLTWDCWIVICEFWICVLLVKILNCDSSLVKLWLWLCRAWDLWIGKCDLWEFVLCVHFKGELRNASPPHKSLLLSPCRWRWGALHKGYGFLVGWCGGGNRTPPSPPPPLPLPSWSWWLTLPPSHLFRLRPHSPPPPPPVIPRWLMRFCIVCAF